MNAELKKKQKVILKNIFLKLMNNNVVFGKTMENLRKHRDNKLITMKAGRTYLNQLIVQQNVFLNIYNEKKTQMLMNKPVYLSLSVLE